MEIEVGQYVRTKNGDIGTIIDIDGLCIEARFNGYTGKSTANHYKIASFDIIDLIEVGDLLMMYSDLHQIDGIQSILVKSENHLKKIKTMIDIEIYDIKSIITKEQMEQMEYKIGE
jgi:hypothetical protein